MSGCPLCSRESAHQSIRHVSPQGEMLIFRGKLSVNSQLKMLSNVLKRWLYRCTLKHRLWSARPFVVLYRVAITLGVLTAFFSSVARAQRPEPAPPVIVQPGAPGKPSKKLPESTTGKLPPQSQADVDFMQGMIMHHAQAVEMTALIPSHTENKDLRLLGARISSSQSDEIKFMKRWLTARGESISMPMPSMKGMDMSYHDMSNHSMPLMPGMLSPNRWKRYGRPRALSSTSYF